MKPVVGICGMGAMGAAVGAHLRRAGLRVVTAAKGRTRASVDRAAAAGVTDLQMLDRVIEEADIVLSIMGSTAAIGFADEITKAFRRNDRARPLFVECNLMLPTAMVEIADRLIALDVRVVDVGISGPPPSNGRSPRFHVSGEHGPEFMVLAEYGLDLDIVGPRIGQATALKVCSAAVWQGCLALVAEVASTAQQYGFSAKLMADLHAHETLIHRWFVSAIGDAPAKAERWAPDMLVVSKMLAATGGNGDYHRAASHFYERLARRVAEGPDAVSAIVDGLLGRIPN